MDAPRIVSAPQHVAEGLDQLEKTDLHLGRGRIAIFGSRLDPGRREDVAPEERPPVELACGLLEALVLEQAGQELRARIGAFRFLGPALHRDQRARLDPRERCGHHQIFGCNVEVELAHEREVLEVLLGHAGDRDLGDIDLILADEMEQEVEGTLEERELDGIADAARLLGGR